MRLAVLTAAALAVGCGSASSRVAPPPRDPAADAAREVIRAADEFVAAARSWDWDRAAAECDVPFLSGDVTAPTLEDDRVALATQLKKVGTGSDWLITPGSKALLVTPVRADNPPAHVAGSVTDSWPSLVSGWTGAVGPDLYLASFSAAAVMEPVRLLVRVRDGKGRVVGMLRVPAADAAPAPPAP
jgi:hypothetical protein